MSGPEVILERLAAAGFELQSFARYPKALGVIRGDYLVLLEYSAAGFKMLGTPGWRFGDAIGVLTTKEGRPVFQSKQNIVEATEEKLAGLRQFRQEVEAALAGVQ